jgi:hypothetical protein
VYPTATPTPIGYEYVVATGSMSTLMIVLLGAVILLSYLLYRQSRWENEDHDYPNSEAPLHFHKGRTGEAYPDQTLSSQAPETSYEMQALSTTGGTSASRRPYAYPQHSVV